jgi:hypothetical protein
MDKGATVGQEVQPCLRQIHSQLPAVDNLVRFDACRHACGQDAFEREARRETGPRPRRRLLQQRFWASAKRELLVSTVIGTHPAIHSSAAAKGVQLLRDVLQLDAVMPAPP